MHDLSTEPGRLTCKTTGYYHVGANIMFAEHATGYRALLIYQNSLAAGSFVANEWLSAVSGSETALNVSTVVYMLVDDWIEVRVRQTSGGNLNLLALPYYSPQFWAHKIS